MIWCRSPSAAVVVWNPLGTNRLSTVPPAESAANLVNAAGNSTVAIADLVRCEFVPVRSPISSTVPQLRTPIKERATCTYDAAAESVSHGLT